MSSRDGPLASTSMWPLTNNSHWLTMALNWSGGGGGGGGGSDNKCVMSHTVLRIYTLLLTFASCKQTLNGMKFSI